MTNSTNSQMTNEVASSEPVGRCPVCGSTARTELFRDLTDNVSFTAPGTWNLQSCGGCGAAYLDPRPDGRTLALAYRGYHTHGGPTAPAEEPGGNPVAQLRRALGNGYRNWRYGTHRTPSTRLGVAAAWAMPGFRKTIDVVFRHLPRPSPGARLLDVGFGSGAFLVAAREAGWDVAGVDTDPAVIEAAKAAGLDVRQGSIEAFADQHERFDVITLSHVIEHVPDPVAVLTQAYALLRPGGHLWLATPNLDSLGLRYFGRHWRGLEAPRHLVLFGWKSMQLALRRAAFQRWKLIHRADATRNMFQVSRDIRDRARAGAASTGAGVAGKPSDEPTLAERLPARRLHRSALAAAATVLPHRAEFLTLMAFKD